MALFLGIDAGGTRTTAVLGDETRTLARAAGASVKPLRVSREEAGRNMAALLSDVAQQAGVDLRAVVSSSIGTAGVRLPQTLEWMREIVSASAGGAIDVCGDEEIALDAAFPGGAGVLVIAGTGSNTLGRTSGGARLNVGGWGPVLGDEGSGYWIGYRGLRAALRAKDFGRPSPILGRVLELWKAHDLNETINIAHANADFSELAPLVADCASEGDATSLEVLNRGGRLLGEDAIEAFRRVRQIEPNQPPPAIAFIGGILDNVRFVRESMMATIHRALPTVRILPEAVDAVSGALWRARNFKR